MANIDSGVDAFDLFFNEEEFVQDAAVEKLVCGVDGAGLLQCVGGDMDELLWCDGEGTIRSANCVLEGCGEADLVVVYA